jgi:glycine betaine/proline transport system substrate-binding protein
MPEAGGGHRRLSTAKQEGANVSRTTSPLGRLGVLLAIAALAFIACSGRGGASEKPSTESGASAVTSGAPASTGPKGTVNIAINPWVGYEADAAVVGYLLKDKLGYTVAEKNLKEEISWQGFETGDVDVVLENWGHPELVKTYIDEKKIAVDAGQTGNKGIIGWYVPPWLAKEHPDVLDWNNLNKYADQFKTSESGGMGQLLDGDPSYVTNDEALVTNLKLNFKVVYAGSEAALIEAFKQAETQKKWLIGYFYEPQWFLAEVPLAHVTLPPYTTGCDADPKKVACDYPPYDLNKVVSKKFADTGGDAYTLVKNFNWTNDDQNEVAKYIAQDKMSDEAAAKKWVEANKDKVDAWLK